MKVAALSLALALGGASISGCAEAHPPYKKLEAMTGQMVMDNALCSGTRAYGPHAFVTTRHCAVVVGAQVRFQGVMANVTKILYDRHENAIVLLDRDMGKGWAKVGPAPEIGDHVYIVGNPLGIKQAYREAVVAWKDYVSDLNTTVFMYPCSCWKGDSGAGIFDRKGRLVGVHFGSVVDTWRHAEGAPVEWYMPYAYPLEFTPEQIAEASL